ncbi:MAG: VanZ family protein [Deltaproteobacteria bacterium]|nr:VanZ family protein [Deltaproteobacteria bacterium]MBW1913695.1 VanZ family protein [Deltaproteobacteria bacterium]
MTIFLSLISGVCFLLLFAGGPDYHSPRSYGEAWNLGHIFLFSTLTYLSVTIWKRPKKWSFLKQAIWILTLTLILGFLIELGQYWIEDRTPDIFDMARNIIGTLVSLTFLLPSRMTLHQYHLRILQCCTIIITFLATLPLAEALIDEAVARKQFPLLSDFESPMEIKRWESDSILSIDDKISRHGRSSLKVQLTTVKYSGIHLQYFPNDWRDFNTLEFSIFNASDHPLRIHCRVHDNYHTTHDQKYSDRFNTSFFIPQGWSDKKIPVQNIVNAPKDRKMNLKNIQNFGIFCINLQQNETIYLDNVRLSD